MKLRTGLILSLLFLIFSFSHISASASGFPDVSTKHYAYDAIYWAESEGLINGYEDGKFGPNDPISGSQFAVLLVEFFNLQEGTSKLIGYDTSATQQNNKGPVHIELKQSTIENWTAPYYNTLASYKVPYLSYTVERARNKELKRGVVAQAIGYLLTGETDLKKNISFLQDNEITFSANPNAYTLPEQFGFLDNLTRGQAVTFLYRLNNKGMREIHNSVKENYKHSATEQEAFGEQAVSALNQLDPRIIDNHDGNIQVSDASKAIELEERVESWKYSKMPISKQNALSLNKAQSIDLDAVNYVASLFSDKTMNLLANSSLKVSLATNDEQFYGLENAFSIYFSDENEYKVMLGYVPNDVNTVEFGKRAYSINIPNEPTKAELEFYASVVSDLSKITITTDILNKIPEWSHKGINVDPQDIINNQSGFVNIPNTVILHDKIRITPNMNNFYFWGDIYLDYKKIK